MSYHQTRYHYRHEKHHSNTLWKEVTNPKPKDTSCRPVPRWEKSFCTEVGGMPWKKFVAAKNNVCESDQVFKWDDSAGLKAFKEAKRRFRAHYHGASKKRLPIDAADLYIDTQIDWNSEIDKDLFDEIKSLSDDEDEGVKEIESFPLSTEPIIATGWDYDCYEPTPRFPTIVGS